MIMYRISVLQKIIVNSLFCNEAISLNRYMPLRGSAPMETAPSVQYSFRFTP